MYLVSLLLSWFFPPLCVICGKTGSYLCPDCLQLTTCTTDPQQELAMTTQAKITCISPFQYQPPISMLIKTCKYQSIYGIGDYIAELLYAHTSLPTADCITAVPMYQKKQTERGFNQSELIAKKLAQILRLPYLSLLIKTKATHAQAQQSGSERTQLETSVFKLNANQNWESLATAKILIVDDVVTTGSTLRACCQLLLEKIPNAAITGITCARGQP